MRWKFIKPYTNQQSNPLINIIIENAIQYNTGTLQQLTHIHWNSKANTYNIIFQIKLNDIGENSNRNKDNNTCFKRAMLYLYQSIHVHAKTANATSSSACSLSQFVDLMPHCDVRKIKQEFM